MPVLPSELFQNESKFLHVGFSPTGKESQVFCATLCVSLKQNQPRCYVIPTCSIRQVNVGLRVQQQFTFRGGGTIPCVSPSRG